MAYRRACSLAVLLLFAACGGDTSGPEADPEVVGPAGGTVQAASGAVTFNVPAGAVPANVRLTAAPAPDPAPTDKTIPGTVYNFGPSGTQFATPITVALKYNPEQLPAGTLPSQLTVSRFQDGKWVPVTTPVTVDSITREVRVQLSSFSMYAVTEKDCSPRVLALGETRTGTLSPDDCVFRADDGIRFDVFQFSVPVRQVVRYTLSADVAAAGGMFFPGTRNAWLARTLTSGTSTSSSVLYDPGIYEVYVRGTNAETTGTYTVKL
jgi:hypothetical protein